MAFYRVAQDVPNFLLHAAPVTRGTAFQARFPSHSVRQALTAYALELKAAISGGQSDGGVVLMAFAMAQIDAGAFKPAGVEFIDANGGLG